MTAGTPAPQDAETIIHGPTAQPIMPLSAEERDRFWRSVDRSGSCWLWIGQRRKGYGIFTYVIDGKYRDRRAHRIAWVLTGNDLDVGRVLDHICRERACVNPEHLRAVTNRVNILAGVSFSAINARKTHCKRGHLLAGENLAVAPRGWRSCRACHNLREREKRAVERAQKPNGGKKTHCPHGHPYDEANTYIAKNGARKCRECTRLRTRRRRARANQKEVS